LIHTDGFVGFAEGLALLRALLEQRWEHVHPRLDPEDDNDPTMRVNTITALVDPGTTLRALRTIPLVASRLGKFSLRDIEIASGESHADAGVQPVEMSVIEAAFQDADLDELKATAEAVMRAGETFAAVDALLLTTVGTMHAPDLTALPPILGRIQGLLGEQLRRRGVVDAALVGEMAATEVVSSTGEITSREDVIRALDRICEYFDRHEPSSPVPLLAKRAKRLVSKSFLEILRDLAPGGVHEAESIRGKED
jgi:type VI secretion system protein ImpA